MNFIAIMTAGESCDYGIGCGVRVACFKADSMDDAVRQALVEINANHMYKEARLETCVVYSVGETHAVDLRELYAEADRKQKAADKAYAEQSERAQLEHLKKKYGA